MWAGETNPARYSFLESDAQNHLRSGVHSDILSARTTHIAKPEMMQTPNRRTIAAAIKHLFPKCPRSGNQAGGQGARYAGIVYFGRESSSCQRSKHSCSSASISAIRSFAFVTNPGCP